MGERAACLEAQRDSMVARVSYHGRTVQYRGAAATARAITHTKSCSCTGTAGARRRRA